MVKPRGTLVITGVCVLSICHATLRAAASGNYTLSNGRRIILEKGIQVAGYGYFSAPSSLNVPNYLNAHYTMLNGYVHPTVLQTLPAGSLFGDRVELGTPSYWYPTGSAAAWAERYHITFDFSGSDFDSLVRLSRYTGLVELVTLTPYGSAQEKTYFLDLTLPGGTGDLFAFWNSNNSLPSVCEPGTFVLLAGGLLSLAVYARRKRR